MRSRQEALSWTYALPLNHVDVLASFSAMCHGRPAHSEGLHAGVDPVFGASVDHGGRRSITRMGKTRWEVQVTAMRCHSPPESSCPTRNGPAMCRARGRGGYDTVGAGGLDGGVSGGVAFAAGPAEGDVLAGSQRVWSCGAVPEDDLDGSDADGWSPRVWDCLPFRAQRRSRRTAAPALQCCSRESIWRVHIPGSRSNASGAPGRMPRQRLPEKSRSGQASRRIERSPIRSGAT